MSDEAPPAPRPRGITIVVHSSATWDNSGLFLQCMEEMHSNFGLSRILCDEWSSAIEMSAVRYMAQHWSRAHGYRPKVVIYAPDRTVAQVDDQPRRWRDMANEEPDAVLIFNPAPRWLEFARLFHDRGIPVNLVVPRIQDGIQHPDYVTWKPGVMTQWPAVVKDRHLAREIRRGRKLKPLTEEEKLERKAHYAEKAALKRQIKRELTRQFYPSGLPKGRPKKTALKRHG